MADMASTNPRKSAESSVQTGKCAVCSFRTGSVRALVVAYLREKRTYMEFNKFVDELGASRTDILRFLRKTGNLVEEKGTLRWVG